MTHQPASLHALIRYAWIAIPAAFAGFPLYVLAPDFYAARAYLSLTQLGFVLLLIRLGDAVLDPVIGLYLDRMQTRLRGPVIGAALVLGLAVFGLFNLVLGPPLLWFSVCICLAIAAHSVLIISLAVRATLWSQDPHQQTRIAALRESFGLIGLVAATSAPTVLSALIPAEQVYGAYSGLLGLLLVIGVMCFSSLPTPVSASSPSTSASSAEAFTFFALWSSLPPQRARLMLVYGLSMLASSLPAVLVIFYIRDLLHAADWTGAFLMIYFLTGALATPLWSAISRRIGPYESWAVAHLLAVATFIGAFFLQTGDALAYAVICALSGLALGADLTLPPALLANQLHQTQAPHLSGRHYALLSFLAKASLALASALALPLLDLAGFKPQSANQPDALLALSAAYALIPCLFKLIAAMLLYHFFIRPNAGEHNESH